MRVKTIWDIGKNLNRIPLEQEILLKTDKQAYLN